MTRIMTTSTDNTSLKVDFFFSKPIAVTKTDPSALHNKSFINEIV